MKSIHQFLDRRRVEKQLRELHTTQAVLCFLTGVPQTALSLWFSGERALSLNVQLKIMAVLAFLKELQSGSELPLDLSDADVLLPRWEKFRRIRLETEVIRQEDEAPVSPGESH